MTRSQTLAALVATLLATTARAETVPAPQLPDYSKTPVELATIAPTGAQVDQAMPKSKS